MKCCKKKKVELSGFRVIDLNEFVSSKHKSDPQRSSRIDTRSS